MFVYGAMSHDFHWGKKSYILKHQKITSLLKNLICKIVMFSFSLFCLRITSQPLKDKCRFLVKVRSQPCSSKFRSSEAAKMYPSVANNSQMPAHWRIQKLCLMPG